MGKIEIKNTTKIKVPNTRFYVLGEQKPSKLWDAYLFDPESNHREILRKNVTTKSFALFSNIILKTSFLYE